MNLQEFKIGEPMTPLQLAKYLKAGIVPIRGGNLPKNAIMYDLKFIWNNPGPNCRTPQYRVYFGNYFRNPNNKVDAISIGPGTTYKTANIVVLMDPPSTVAERYSVRVYYARTSRPSHTNVGHVDAKPLLQQFVEAGKEVGIAIHEPTKPDEKMVVTCTLIPYDKSDSPDKKMCIIQIDDLQYS